MAGHGDAEQNAVFYWDMIVFPKALCLKVIHGPTEKFVTSYIQHAYLETGTKIDLEDLNHLCVNVLAQGLVKELKSLGVERMDF